jgi:ferredoxin
MMRRAVIDQDACKRCGECERNCPSKAITRSPRDGRFRVQSKHCIACCCCTEVCPHDAVSLRTPWPKRAARRVLTAFR